MGICKGMWKNDRQKGKGFWRFSDGVLYTGVWNDGVAEEGGMWQFPDGTMRLHSASSQKDLPDLAYVNYKGTCTTSLHDAVGEFEAGCDPPTWIYPNGS